MYVCCCRAVTEAEVEALGARGVTSGVALVRALGLDQPGCCGRCLLDTDRLTAIARRGRARSLTLVGALAAGS